MSEHLDVKFHIFDLVFQPYKEQSDKIGSFNILKSCLKLTNDVRLNNKRLIIFDRYENRDKAESRKLFISIAAYSSPDKMFKCKMHLIRDKIPSFMDKENLTFSSVDILKNKELVETTNFYVDMDKNSYPTITCEYNNIKPKISNAFEIFLALRDVQKSHFNS